MNRLDNYYRAIGKFINEFAKAEEMLLVMLGRVTSSEASAVRGRVLGHETPGRH